MKLQKLINKYEASKAIKRYNWYFWNYIVRQFHPATASETKIKHGIQETLRQKQEDESFEQTSESGNTQTKTGRRIIRANRGFRKHSDKNRKTNHSSEHRNQETLS